MYSSLNVALDVLEDLLLGLASEGQHPEQHLVEDNSHLEHVTGLGRLLPLQQLRDWQLAGNSLL